MDNKILVILGLLLALCIAGVFAHPFLMWLWGTLLAIASFTIGLFLPIVLMIILIILVCKK